jgi:hypothetical protein
MRHTLAGQRGARCTCARDALGQAALEINMLQYDSYSDQYLKVQWSFA